MPRPLYILTYICGIFTKVICASSAHVYMHVTIYIYIIFTHTYQHTVFVTRSIDQPISSNSKARLSLRSSHSRPVLAAPDAAAGLAEYTMPQLGASHARGHPALLRCSTLAEDSWATAQLDPSNCERHPSSSHRGKAPWDTSRGAP